MIRILYAMLCMTIFSGCAASDVVVQRQSSMEGRLEQVMQAQKASRAELAAVAVQVQELRELTARQAAAEKEFVLKNDALQERLKILASRVVQLESAARQSAKIELVNQEDSPEGREESIQSEYMKAFGLFSANSFTAAADAFSSFITAYPESEYAANARYWLGECYFSLERYKEAIETYERVLDMNPVPKRAADTMLRIGDAWYRLDEPAKGESVLKLLREKYPDSEAAAASAGQRDKKSNSVR